MGDDWPTGLRDVLQEIREAVRDLRGAIAALDGKYVSRDIYASRNAEVDRRLAELGAALTDVSADHERLRREIKDDASRMMSNRLARGGIAISAVFGAVGAAVAVFALFL